MLCVVCRKCKTELYMHYFRDHSHMLIELLSIAFENMFEFNDLFIVYAKLQGLGIKLPVGKRTVCQSSCKGIGLIKKNPILCREEF